MKEGDRFLQELAQRRQEAEKLRRLAFFKAYMANADKDEVCDVCGAHKSNYRETLGEDCWHGH